MIEQEQKQGMGDNTQVNQPKPWVNQVGLKETLVDWFIHQGTIV